MSKCPSSIRRRDLNPRPSERESPPINTRPACSIKRFLGNLRPFCPNYGILAIYKQIHMQNLAITTNPYFTDPYSFMEQAPVLPPLQNFLA